MTKAQKKVITIETFERTVIRQIPNHTQTLWCEFCQAEIEMITPELAATILGVKVREIYRRIERGRFHFVENQYGLLVICLNSLEFNKNK
jgi:hypothetical protein